ncbi:MAG: TolC family protein, partial [Bacteroidia bacterium]|nr:TolC family protein [Bacteroidia bacterium]
ALQNNPQVKSATLEVEQQKALKKTAYELPKTNFSVIRGQINTPVKDNYYGISQDIYFPSVYVKQSKAQNENTLLSNKNLLVTQSELIRNVKSTFFRLIYANEYLKLLAYQDSVYKNFSERAEVKYKTGESSYLEMISAKNKYTEIQLQKKQAETDNIIYRQELRKLLNVDSLFSVTYEKYEKLTLTIVTDTLVIKQNPLLGYYNQKIVLANAEYAVEKNKFFSNFSIGYWTQSIDLVKGFSGVQLGFGIPIFFWGQQGRVQSAKIQTKIAESDYQNFQNNLRTLFNQTLQEYQTYLALVNYYENAGLQQAGDILKVAVLSYQKGEIGYVEYVQNLSQALGIKTQYLQALNQLNQTVIDINYLTGK